MISNKTPDFNIYLARAIVACKIQIAIISNFT